MPAPTDVIVRIYEVVVVADGDPYDPFTVTLSWPEPVAATLDKDSPAVKEEAFRRAIKVERRNHTTPDNTDFTNGGVTFLRERLIPAAKAH